jgi:hypothetical protein
MKGEQNYPGLRKKFLQFWSSFNPVQTRHRGIKNYQIWFQILGFIDGVQAVNGFATDTELALLFKVSANQFTHLREIVNDKNCARLFWPDSVSGP